MGPNCKKYIIIRKQKKQLYCISGMKKSPSNIKKKIERRNRGLEARALRNSR